MKKIIFWIITFLLILETSYAEDNYIQNGAFEKIGAYKYGTGTYADRIVGISDSSVSAIWAKHSYIVGYSADAHSGEKSLNLRHVNPYYPVTFKVSMERGYAYKFSAWVKLTDESANFKANLLATTKSADMSGGEDVYLLKNGSFDDKYKAETIWSSEWSSDMTEFSKDEWVLFERTIYVAGKEGNVSAYIGMAHMGGTFDYLIDDVSLVKLPKEIVIDDGYETVYAVKGKEKVYSYKAESSYISSKDILWSVSGDTDGIAIGENGKLMVSDFASGSVTITAKGTISETGEELTKSKTVTIVPEFIPDINLTVDDKVYNDFFAENESYLIDYYEEERPEVEFSGDYEIRENSSGDLITVTDGERTKFYEVFLKQKSYSDNLFYDGGFEEGIVDEAKEGLAIRNGTIGITNKNVHSGRYALKIGANQYTTLSMKVDAENGKLYMVSMWIKNSQDSAQKKIFPCFSCEDEGVVEFYSEQDKRFVKGGVFEENNYSRAITVTDEWQRVDRLIRVNGEDKKSKLNFGFTIYSATAEFYVDDVNIYEIELEENNGTYFGAVYKDKNGEFAKKIETAESAEIFVYNPEGKILEMMTNVAAYQNRMLIGVTGGSEIISDVASVIKYDLGNMIMKDEVKIFIWNKELKPYIDSVELGGLK